MSLGNEFVVPFAIVMTLFAMMVADGRNPLKGRLGDAQAQTAHFFTIGEVAIGSISTIARLLPYGAAGSLALIWAYYSAQIFFYGAEITKLYSYRYGSWAHRQ